MKAITTTVFGLLLLGRAFGQSYTTSEENSAIKYYVSNNGRMFNNAADQKGGYLIPKDSLVSAFYAMMPMMAAEDVNGQLHGAAVTMDSSDFFNGCVVDNYLNSEHLTRFAESIWFMSKAEVENHRDHWSDPGYTMSANIANWPGNGDPTIGEPALLAPFYDAGQDGSYDPMEGDYPLIRGDRALYTIATDKAGVHASGFDPLGVEMHMMFYQFENVSDPVLTNTTFILTTVYNRGPIDYPDFRFGHLADFDLGNNLDDYIGTDVARNLSYVYNGDQDDEDNGAINGYGLNPPAVGVIALDGNLYANVRHLTAYNSSAEISRSLLGLQNDGSPFLDDNNQPTTYLFTEPGTTGWNEATAGDMPGDRRSVIGYEGAALQPYGSVYYNTAIVYARSNDGTLFASVDSLLSVTDHIQQFFDDQNWDLGVNESKLLSIELYPNPAQHTLSVSGIDSGIYRILTLDGKVIKSGNLNASGIDVEALNKGFYVLEVTSNGKQGRKSFVKE